MRKYVEVLMIGLNRFSLYGYWTVKVIGCFEIAQVKQLYF